MRSAIVGLGLWVSLALGGESYAAGFDCAKAIADVEKIICADDELSKLDDAMSHTYRVAVRKAAGNAALLRGAQKRWLKERNQCADRGCLFASYTFRLWQLASPDPAHPTPPEPSVVFPPGGGKPAPTTKPALSAARSQDTGGVVGSGAPHPPDLGRYEKEKQVLERVKQLFLSHVDRARNVSIPYIPSEFPWRIDWDKQQAYCQDVWNAFTTERERRLRFFEEPAASIYRDGEEAYKKAWRALKFERGCFDEFQFGDTGYFQTDRDFSLYDHSPDWIVELWPELSSLKTGRFFLGNSRLIYAREPDVQGHRCNMTTLRNSYSAGVFAAVPYAKGGIETFFALVDGRPLILTFGIYVSEMDFSGIETNTYWPGHQESEASYFAWFGKRRGRIGQGFVAVESHQTNLYRSLALEPNGYKETYYGIVPLAEGKEAKALEFALHVDYQQFVCVINFDLDKIGKGK